MNRVVAIVAAGCLLAGAALVIFTVTRPQPPPPPATSSEGREIAAVRPAPATPPSPAAPAIAPEPVRRPARREPAAKPAPPTATEAAAPLEPVHSGGTLHIASDVPGAQVFIDRQFIGAAPVTASDVKPGSHRLNVSAQGYEGVAETIEVSPGPRDILIALKDVRLDAAIDVVHKHRIGSCKGRLIATPRGLRYETTNKDDGFSSALLELGTFQVDYLEKNLRVTPRSGKRYDFADPEGNADRLFVFHRDVEKARERLKRGDPPAAR